MPHSKSARRFRQGRPAGLSMAKSADVAKAGATQHSPAAAVGPQVLTPSPGGSPNPWLGQTLCQPSVNQHAHHSQSSPVLTTQRRPRSPKAPDGLLVNRQQLLCR
ncbi:MAG: hypothetical protein QOJ06_1631 [Pseudonocardiales bacterium]|jgi:hypothetical protein|nr:hypothetical protein [Pseudonocardiales bacterium]